MPLQLVAVDQESAHQPVTRKPVVAAVIDGTTHRNVLLTKPNALCAGYHLSTWLLLVLGLTVATFIIVYQVVCVDPNGNECLHHAYAHSAIATFMFVAITIITQIMVTHIGAYMGPPLAGAFTAIGWFVCRETRDYEKRAKAVFTGRALVQFTTRDNYDDYQWHVTLPVPGGYASFNQTQEYAKLGDCSNTCSCVYGTFESFDTYGLVPPVIVVVCFLVAVLATHVVYLRRRREIFNGRAELTSPTSL